MKLLNSGITTAASTFCGTTAGGGGAGTAPAGTGTYGAGHGFTIRRVVAQHGGSSVAPGSAGAISLRYGDSSNVVQKTLPILVQGMGGDISSKQLGHPTEVSLDGFYIKCNWFELVANIASSAGAIGHVFGD